MGALTVLVFAWAVAGPVLRRGIVQLCSASKWFSPRR